ncbi:unnamed protein product [Ambrosiozyma monospora]|uniref:Unnamed protein product n=1 Tax=Ambrosiozyma monospora TaxID=43982 RepID=A0ACB5U7D6_AMBMO|nr:unnamed protein product [Ambrosiozyma monospora]
MNFVISLCRDVAHSELDDQTSLKMDADLIFFQRFIFAAVEIFELPLISELEVGHVTLSVYFTQKVLGFSVFAYWSDPDSAPHGQPYLPKIQHGDNTNDK